MPSPTGARSTNPPKAEPLSQPALSTSDARTSEDVLAGLTWSGQRLLVVAAALLVVGALFGCVYEASYFGYFRVPVEAVDLSIWDVLAQGARLFLLPLTVVPVAFVAGAPTRPIRQGALAAGGYILFLAFLAAVSHLLSPILLPIEILVAIVIAGVVFMLRRGFGLTPLLRLVLGAAALLLAISLAVASGVLDAGQTASAKQSTLRIVTRDSALPGSSVDGVFFASSNYVLLRETDNRLWLLRIDDHNTYSVAKSDVLYIRY